MVASDTVVGLVGAGILLIALVGVFIVESGGGPATGELEAASFSLQSAGSYASSASGGTTPPQVCALNPAAPGCTGPSTEVHLTLSGLPKIGNSYYVAFLTGGGNPAELLGQLTESGTDHKLDAESAEDTTGFTELIVTVEATATPTAPNTALTVYQKAISGGTADLAGTANSNATMGQGEVRLNQAGGGVQVSATLEDVANMTGVTYRAWFVEGDMANATYSFVGNFTFGGSNATQATLTETVDGIQLADQGWFWVTFEGTAAPGTKPGYPILVVEL